MEPVTPDADVADHEPHAVEVEQGVVHDEEYHRVLADKADKGHAPQGQGEEDARESAQGAKGVRHGAPGALHPLVQGHVALPVPMAVAVEEEGGQHQGEEEEPPAGEAAFSLVPPVAEFEAEDGHGHVAEAQPEGVALPPQPVTEGGEQGPEPVHPREEPPPQVDDEVHHEEGEEEPDGRIAVELAHAPKVVPVDGAPRGGEEAGPPVEEGEEEGVPDESPGEVGNQEPARLVADEGTRVARHRLIEVACLEEKEAEKEEGPRHELLEPELVTQVTHADDMQENHAHDAESAQEVKGVVSWSRAGHHGCKVTVKRAKTQIYRQFSERGRPRLGVSGPLHLSVSAPAPKRF